VSRYIESNIQEEALVNYIPNQEVITLIEEELGLESYYSTLDQEKRSLLENILYSLDEEQTSQVQADITDEVSSVNKRVADQKITSIDTTEESDAVAEEATYDFD
jgi:hypothetical protein